MDETFINFVQSSSGISSNLLCETKMIDLEVNNEHFCQCYPNYVLSGCFAFSYQ